MPCVRRACGRCKSGCPTRGDRALRPNAATQSRMVARRAAETASQQWLEQVAETDGWRGGVARAASVIRRDNLVTVALQGDLGRRRNGRPAASR